MTHDNSTRRQLLSQLATNIPSNVLERPIQEQSVVCFPSTLSKQIDLKRLVEDFKASFNLSTETLPSSNWQTSKSFTVRSAATLCLFLDLIPINEDKNLVMGQPHFNAKSFFQFTEDAIDANCLCSLVPYKKNQIDSGAENALVQPVELEFAGCSTAHDDVAVTLDQADYDDAFQLLFSIDIDKVIEELEDHGIRSSNPLVLLLFLIHVTSETFDLSHMEGWMALFCTLAKSEWGKDTTKNLLQLQLTKSQVISICTIIFWSKIEIKVACLAGESLLLCLKNEILSIDAHPVELPCIFEVTGQAAFSDKELPTLALKERSHHLLVAASRLTQTASLLDLVLEYALSFKKQPPVWKDGLDYELDLKRQQEKAIQWLIDNRTFNPHVQLILQSYQEKTRSNMDDARVQDLLKKFADKRFSPMKNKRLPQQLWWIVSVLTQFIEDKSSSALLDLLKMNKNLNLLPGGDVNATFIDLNPYVEKWDTIFKLRKHLSNFFLEKFGTSNGGKKVFSDKTTRHLSTATLTIVKRFGLSIQNTSIDVIFGRALEQFQKNGTLGRVAFIDSASETNILDIDFENHRMFIDERSDDASTSVEDLQMTFNAFSFHLLQNDVDQETKDIIYVSKSTKTMNCGRHEAPHQHGGGMEEEESENEFSLTNSDTIQEDQAKTFTKNRFIDDEASVNTNGSNSEHEFDANTNMKDLEFPFASFSEIASTFPKKKMLKEDKDLIISEGTFEFWNHYAMKYLEPVESEMENLRSETEHLRAAMAELKDTQKKTKALLDKYVWRTGKYEQMLLNGEQPSRTMQEKFGNHKSDVFLKEEKRRQQKKSKKRKRIEKENLSANQSSIGSIGGSSWD